MTEMIDYYYGMLSPFALLGHKRFQQLAEEHGKTVRYKPSDFIERIFARTGGLKLHDRSDARRAYRIAELSRWSHHLSIHLNVEPKHFPVADELASRFAIAVDQRGLDIGEFTFSVLTAVWQQDRDVSDPGTLVAIADQLGLPANELLKEARSDASLKLLEQNCDDAVAAGVFGTPSYVYEGDVFWGQDRLSFLKTALTHLT